LLEAGSFDHHAVLNTLLRDPDPGIKNLAIKVAKEWKVADAVPILIDFLSTPYYRQAFEALVQMGENAVELLEQTYFKTGVEQKTLNRITRIIGQIGGEAAISSLVGKINYQNREVEGYALRALKDLNYQAGEKELPAILQGVRSAVYQIAWFLAAQYTSIENEMGDSLQGAIEEELINTQDHMYLLLSLAYDPNSIHHIRENLESGTSEGIGFAIELMDIFVADEVKPVLFPVLEDTSTVEKIRKLQAEFPIVIPEPYELLTAIINRDPNLVGPVTKASAIRMLDRIEGTSVTNDLIAQVFNPDPLLSELAAVQIARIDPAVPEDLLARVHPERKNHLRRIIKAKHDGKDVLVWDKILSVKQNSWFHNLPALLHYRIAEHMERIELTAGKECQVTGAAGETGLAILVGGEAGISLGEDDLGKLSPGEMTGIFPFMISQKDFIRILVHRDSILYTMKQEDLDELIFDYEDIALVMYRWAEDQQTRMKKPKQGMVS